MSVDRRRAMIEPEHARLSIVRQCELVGISRSSWYYRPGGESDLNLRLMREIDEQYLITPWYGSRQMARHLRRLGYDVGRKRVRRLMRLMGLRALAPQPGYVATGAAAQGLSVSAAGHCGGAAESSVVR